MGKTAGQISILEKLGYTRGSGGQGFYKNDVKVGMPEINTALNNSTMVNTTQQPSMFANWGDGRVDGTLYTGDTGTLMKSGFITDSAASPAEVAKFNTDNARLAELGKINRNDMTASEFEEFNKLTKQGEQPKAINGLEAAQVGLAGAGLIATVDNNKFNERMDRKLLREQQKQFGLDEDKYNRQVNVSSALSGGFA